MGEKTNSKIYMYMHAFAIAGYFWPFEQENDELSASISDPFLFFVCFGVWLGVGNGWLGVLTLNFKYKL